MLGNLNLLDTLAIESPWKWRAALVVLPRHCVHRISIFWHVPRRRLRPTIKYGKT